MVMKEEIRLKCLEEDMSDMSGTEQVNSEIIHKIENDGKLIQNFAMTKAL